MSKLIEHIDFDKSEVEAVVALAEELISQNQLIEMEKLFRRAKRELKINPRNLTSIIKYLFKEQFFLEGSKLIKQELLKNPIRAAIYEFIKKNPGVNFVAIKRFAFSTVKGVPSSELEEDELGSSGQFIWHLEVLIKFGCIKKIDFKKYSLFVIDEVEPQIGIYYFVLRDNINRKIFHYLINNSSIKQSEIPRLTGLSKGSVSHRIKVLKEMNILISEKLGRTFEIKLNTDKKEQLLRVYDDLESNLLKMKEDNKIPPEKPEEELKIEKHDFEQKKILETDKILNPSDQQGKAKEEEKTHKEVNKSLKIDKKKRKKEREKI